MTGNRADGPRESSDQVGLGRVLEDRLPGGRPAPEDDDAPGGSLPAAEDSFPASDPPTWMSDPATPEDEGRTRDVPDPEALGE